VRYSLSGDVKLLVEKQLGLGAIRITFFGVIYHPLQFESLPRVLTACRSLAKVGARLSYQQH
jgi:hypothetical protein